VPSTSQALSTVKEATGLAYTVTSSLKVSVHSVPDSVTVRLMVYTPGSRSKLGSSISEVATWTSKTSRTTQSKVKVAPSKPGVLALDTVISVPSTSQALSTVKEATGLAYTVTSSLKVSVHSVPDSVTVRLMVY